MKRKWYTEPQIVFALQQAEAGTPVAEICRKQTYRICDLPFRELRQRHPRAAFLL